MHTYNKLYSITILTVLVFVGLPAISAFGSQAALDMLQDNTDGDVGLYLKRVNGPVGVNFQGGQVFEPASAIKVLIHVHAMRQVQTNPGINLGTLVSWFGDLSKYDNNNNYLPGGNDCYSNNTVPELDTLQLVLRYMMESSDNACTQATRDFFGDNNINATRIALGMNDTLLDHSIGCGGPAVTNHNRLTLIDVGSLHEQVANGYLNAPTRADFYDLMLDNSAPTNFDQIVNEEAAKQGKMNLVADFRSKISFARKGGSYGLTDGQYRSVAGWIRFPFTHGSSYREYVFGVFVDSASSLDLQNTGSNLSVNAVASEMMRQLIKGALWTWSVPGLKVPDLDGSIDSLKAYADDTPPTPLLDQIKAAQSSLEEAQRLLAAPSPSLQRVMTYFRFAVGNFDHAVATGMLDLERGHHEAAMITRLGAERARGLLGVALALGDGRAFTSTMEMAEQAMEVGDRLAEGPMTAFPNSFYNALDSYQQAISLAESTLR